MSYATDVKRSLLGVSDGPVVSESAAREMAAGVRDVLGADIGLSLTGVAGPAEQDGQPVGTLYVGMVGPGFDDVRLVRLPGSARSDAPVRRDHIARVPARTSRTR